ncbi:MAG: hydrogenase expression/formation protein HypE [Phycisphaerales bacterium]|nr:hydrogenase expression/formation protein HypE [Phycisphaerales bacterium]
MSATQLTTPIRPLPTAADRILLAHGGGGTLMHRLIDEVFLSRFGDPKTQEQHDAAVVTIGSARLAFTTDSYVVRPLFFPGGDIGSLAVHGTVNDLAMSGARPLVLSAGFVLEEGFPIDDLRRIVDSMASAARRAAVRIITGDTKVVDRGKGDGVYINTAGIGIIDHQLNIVPTSVRAGDAIIVNGDIGRHGMAIMARREGLEFETAIESDSAAVSDLVQDLLAAGVAVHCLRDLTRGGLASALNEISAAAGWGMELDESSIPIRPDVYSACEILGFDPLYVACEGRFVAFVPQNKADATVRVLKSHTLGSEARIIGRVSDDQHPLVVLKTRIGSRRIVDMLSGEQLPRIC